MDEAEKALDAAIGKAVEETMKPLPLRTVPPKPVSLSEQWGKAQAIEVELRSRVQREKMAAKAEFDRLMLDIRTDYERRRDDALTILYKEERNAMQRLIEQTAEKLRELELLAQRMALT